MQEETKRLFNAPWRAEEYKNGKGAFLVRNNDGYLVAENMSKQDAECLAQLPELYDALDDAINTVCDNCVLHPMSCCNCHIDKRHALLMHIKSTKESKTC